MSKLTPKNAHHAAIWVGGHCLTYLLLSLHTLGFLLIINQLLSVTLSKDKFLAKYWLHTLSLWDILVRNKNAISRKTCL